MGFQVRIFSRKSNDLSATALSMKRTQNRSSTRQRPEAKIDIQNGDTCPKISVLALFTPIPTSG